MGNTRRVETQEEEEKGGEEDEDLEGEGDGEAGGEMEEKQEEGVKVREGKAGGLGLEERCLLMDEKAAAAIAFALAA